MDEQEVTKSLLETTKGVYTIDYANDLIETAYFNGYKAAEKAHRGRDIASGLVFIGAGVSALTLSIMHLRGWRFSLKAKKGSTEHEFTTEKETNEGEQ